MPLSVGNVSDSDLSTQLQSDSSASNGIDPAGILPDELFLKILSYLEVPDLVRCRMTSWEWKRLAEDQSLEKDILLYRDLKMLREKNRFIGEEAWQFLGKIDNVPALPENLLEELNKPCPWTNPEGKPDGNKVKDTHILGLMMDKVDDKPVTISSIGELVKTPKEAGHATKYNPYSWQRIFDDHGEATIEEPYWALMTREVLEDSRGKSRAIQLEMAMAHEGYRAVNLREAIVFNLVRYVSTGQRLFSDDPWTFTCCQEQTNGSKLVVGGFSPSGLGVDSARFDNGDVGVAALWKF